MSWLEFDPALHSEMARRAQRLDWSKTLLGPLDDWSPHLRLVTAGFPMAVRWGPALVFIYNDAYC